MQNDKPEPFNAGAETKRELTPEQKARIDALFTSEQENQDDEALTPEQESRDEELLTALGKFLENAGALRVTLYAAQRAEQQVTTGTPLISLVIDANETDAAFVLGPDARNDLLVALATDGNLAVRIERGVAF
jgi:hypothetical protein